MSAGATAPAADAGGARTSLPSLLTLLGAAILLWSYFSVPATLDAGLHLAVGRWILAHHAIPRTAFPLFTTPDHPWITQEWASGLAFALVERVAGFAGLFALAAVLQASMLLTLARVGREQGADPLAVGLLTVLATDALGFYAGLRGWLFSHLFLAVELLIVDRVQRDPRRARLFLVIPPLLAVWILFHGLYVVGFVFFALALAQWSALLPAAGREERWRRVAMSAGLLAGTVALLLLNPHGLEGVLTPLRYLRPPADSGLTMIRRLDEYGALVPLSLRGAFWAALAAGALACLRRRPELLSRAPQAISGAFFLALTVRQQRQLALAVIFLFPVLCACLLVPLRERLAAARSRAGRYLRGLSVREGAPRTIAARVVPIVIAALPLALVRGPAFEATKLHAENFFPMPAVRALDALPPGRLFADFNWSGAVEWFAPQWPLFIDIDPSSYPREVFEDYFAIGDLDADWRDRMGRWRIDTVLLPPRSQLVVALRDDPEWSVVYEDDDAALLRRR